MDINEMIVKTMLERKNKLFVPENLITKEFNFEAVMEFNENLKPLGFVFSPMAIQVIAQLDYNNDETKDFVTFVIDVLKEKSGVKEGYDSMYKNFPMSVHEMSDEELEIQRITGYFVDLLGYLYTSSNNEDIIFDFRKGILFDGEVKERAKLQDNVEYNVINLCSAGDYCDLFHDMMAGRNSLSESDKKDLKDFLTLYPEAYIYIPKTIPFKENLVFVFNIALEMGWDVQNLPLKTAVDILRLAVSLSDGDISLSSPTKFRNFTRKEKTMLLTALNSINKKTLIEDVYRYREPMKRLTEKLTLNDPRYANKYSRIHEVMQAMYDHKKFETYRNQLAKNLLNSDTTSAVDMLKKRPGEFARSLDKLLRDCSSEKDIEYVLTNFKNVANTIPTGLLWDLVYHFNNRNDGRRKIAFPKGVISRALLIETEVAPICDEVCKKTADICIEAILAQYSDRKEMGYVYINPDLKNYVMPFSNRSASKNSHSLTRGTRLKIREGANAARFFVRWIGDDIDLSASFLNENYESLEHVSFTNLRHGENDEYCSVHSGDIRWAPKGASEYIDVDFKKLEKMTPDARYIAMTVYNFTGTPFARMKECFVGVMEREGLNSGEIFEPSTVKIKSDLTNDTTTALPIIFDLKTKEIIWVDLSMSEGDRFGCGFMIAPVLSRANTVERHTPSIALACEAFVNLKKVNVYDVVMANIKARNGKLVHLLSAEEAGIENETGVVWVDKSDNMVVNEKDILFFDLDRGITPMDKEHLVSEYL